MVTLVVNPDTAQTPVRLKRGGVDYAKGRPFWTDERIEEGFRYVTEVEIVTADGRVLKSEGKTPTYHLLDSMGPEYTGLSSAIGTRGGIYHWRRRIKKEDSDRREDYSLKEKEALMEAMDPLVQASVLINPKTSRVVKKKSRKVPTQRQLYLSGNYTLLNAAYAWHSGINGVRQYYGETAVERKKPKWKPWENAASALQELTEMEFYRGGKKIKEAGENPGPWQLRNFGSIRAVRPSQGEVDLEKYVGLDTGLYRYHGGIVKALNRLPSSQGEIINDMPSFLAELETNERVEELVRSFYTEEHLAEYALARALAARFPSNFTGKPDFIEPEKLRKYKGENPTMADVLKVVDVADKDRFLSIIILNMARDRTFGSLGENPTEDKINEAYKMAREREETETDSQRRKLLAIIRQEFDSFMEVRSRYDDYIRAAKERDPTFQPHQLTFGQMYGAFSSWWRQGRMLFGDVAGYGKTAQEIAAKIIREIYHGKKPTIVFGPNSAKEVWREEMQHDYPEPRIRIVNSYDDETLDGLEQQDVVVFTYEAAGSPHTRRKVIQRLGELRSLEIVLDEAQALKGFKTRRFRTLKPQLDRAAAVDLVSFTPFETMKDVYATLSILEPEAYPTPQHAERAFLRDPLVLHAAVSAHMLRRGVQKLPPAEYVAVELSPQELDAYSKILTVDYGNDAQAKFNQLMKVVTNPVLVEPEFLGSEALQKALQGTVPAKFLAVDRILQGMKPDEKAVIFSPYLRRGVMEEMQRRYAEYGALRIDGTVPYGYRNSINQREEIRQWWLGNDTNRVLIINEASAESLSLAYFGGRTHGIFLGMPTSVIEFMQFLTREMRSGNKDVVFYNLAAQYPGHPLGSVDEGLTELIGKKLEVNRVLLEGGRLAEDGRTLLSDIPHYRQRPVAARLWTPEQLEARAKKKQRKTENVKLIE